MKVVALGAEAIEEVAALAARAFDPRYGEAWTAAQCRAGLVLPGYGLRGVVVDGYLQAFAIRRSIVDESELLLIATAPECRGRGLGTLLLDEWRDAAEATQRQFLEMRADNAARSLYEQHGFSEIGRRAGYYLGRDGIRRDAITMQRLVNDSAAS